jgi:predicted DNA-binding ribbon-helix-helix protein
VVPLDCVVAALLAMTYSVARKRSVTIAGHETSVSLEPMFWDALEAAAAKDALPLNALIARIDAERLDSAPPPNLTSAIRQWLFARAQA